MSAPSLRGFLKAGLDVLTTSVNRATGKILAQIGSVTEQTADGDNVEWWQHVGFASRPAKPTPGQKSAQAVLMSAGDHDIAIASQDTRYQDRYGNLDHGETVVYAVGPDGTGQARILLKKDGSVTLFTTDTNTAAGQSVYFRVKKDGFDWVAPWGTLKFDSTGFHVLHGSGASFDLGGIGGLPAPLDQISSYVRMEAGTVVANCSGAPVADATAVAAILAAIQTEIVAIAAQFAVLATKGNINGLTDVAPLSTALAAVVATATTTIGTQTVLIPKSSTAT